MTQITIQNVDDHVVQGLKQIAWHHGVPFDESLRRLLNDAVEEAHMRFSAQRPISKGIAEKMPLETD